ncbi:GntR family transcriptional regulator [Nonomuraea diastatica]|uniref:GntR family transcriptional regulator n=1 Tax=Nonomuraea diastatica TaxID=1848329 RepID=A0A4R4VYW2_9ACTN|nr:GntR family transcriptional regulator [Nonomuraea diastatica]TDD11322.1 GntR family transcriptional regulator [Nonomuraea diastatica]
MTASLDGPEVQNPTPGERVAAGVLADIEAGRLKHGDQLPAEPELQAEYGVGRAAVRSGLDRLRQQGLIVTVHGSGSFVARPGQQQPPMSSTARMLKDIRDGIAEGRLKEGDQLPKEPELMATYNLSSPAIRAALRELREEGLIHSRGRLGRFVGPQGIPVRREPTKGQTIAEEITSQIRAGRYLPGESLPGESSLAEKFGVARKVVRAALALLRERDLVETVAPKGTFVKPRS